MYSSYITHYAAAAAHSVLLPLSACLVVCVAVTAAVSSPSSSNHVDGILRAHHRITGYPLINRLSSSPDYKPGSIRQHPRLPPRSGVRDDADAAAAQTRHSRCSRFSSLVGTLLLRLLFLSSVRCTQRSKGKPQSTLRRRVNRRDMEVMPGGKTH